MPGKRVRRWIKGLFFVGIILLLFFFLILYQDVYQREDDKEDPFDLAIENPKGEAIIAQEESSFFEAEGTGFSPLGTDTAQMKLLARRGAQVDAQKNLLLLLKSYGQQEEDMVKGSFVVEGSESFFTLEDGRIGCQLRVAIQMATR